MNWRAIIAVPAYAGTRRAASGRGIAIGDFAVLTGHMRPCALALVVEWAVLHQAAILVDWERAAKGEPVMPIPPLA